MENQNFTKLNAELDYGIFTAASKGWNIMLGDKTERTVSRRTAHRLIKTFDLKNLSDDNAEHIVHLGMGATLSCLTSKNQNLQIFGGLMILVLTLLYLNGKQQPAISTFHAHQWSNLKLK